MDLVVLQVLQIKPYESSFKCNWNHSIMSLTHGVMPFTRRKGHAGTDFQRRNFGLIGFDLLMPPSQDTRPAQMTSSWADVHYQCNLVELKSFEVYPS